MKHSAKQLTKAYIHDNRQYIEGNVAEHLMLNLEGVSSYHEYLSDEEIEEYENATLERRAEMEKEVENWITENFSYDIQKYEDLLNWAELSRTLAGDRSSITRDRIPAKHKKKIDKLLEAIENVMKEEGL
jgi:hypothetical protein